MNQTIKFYLTNGSKRIQTDYENNSEAGRNLVDKQVQTKLSYVISIDYVSID